MCLGEVGRIIEADCRAGTTTVAIEGRAITALLIALEDGGAGLRAGDGVLVHFGLVIEVLDDATTEDLIHVRRLVRHGAVPSAASHPQSEETPA